MIELILFSVICSLAQCGLDVLLTGSFVLTEDGYKWDGYILSSIRKWLDPRVTKMKSIEGPMLEELVEAFKSSGLSIPEFEKENNIRFAENGIYGYLASGEFEGVLEGKFSKIKWFLLQPIIFCVVCFSGFYTFLLYLLLRPDIEPIKLLAVIPVVALLNFIYSKNAIT